MRTELGAVESITVGVLALVLFAPASWLYWAHRDKVRTGRLWLWMTVASVWLLGGGAGLGLLVDNLAG